MLGRKRIRKLRCLSVASVEAFPFFDLHRREPAGQRSAVAPRRAPAFAYIFLAKQEK